MTGLAGRDSFAVVGDREDLESGDGTSDRARVALPVVAVDPGLEARQQVGDGGVDPGKAVSRQFDQDRAGIIGVADAAHQPFAFQTVDAVGHGARGDHGACQKRARRQPSFFASTGLKMAPKKRL